MRYFYWAKLILLKPKVILLSKLKVNTSQTRRARARHLCQAQVKLVMTQAMRMVMKTPSLLSYEEDYKAHVKVEQEGVQL